jgi:hypothetical protein
MILANDRSKYSGDLLQYVRGAVFFGVPHRGADIAYWASFAANVLQFCQLGLRTNPAYVKALQRNSPTFANISAQFVDPAERLSIRTFYETERMGNQVVSSFAVGRFSMEAHSRRNRLWTKPQPSSDFRMRSR